MTEEKKRLILVICLSITILITVIGVISSIDIGEDIAPKPTPVVTTNSGALECSHPAHTTEAIPKCIKCNATMTHTFGMLIYNHVDGTITHKAIRTCIVCGYSNEAVGECTYSNKICVQCSGLCPHVNHNVMGKCLTCGNQFSIYDGHYWHDKNGNCKTCGTYVGHLIVGEGSVLIYVSNKNGTHTATWKCDYYSECGYTETTKTLNCVYVDGSCHYCGEAEPTSSAEDEDEHVCEDNLIDCSVCGTAYCAVCETCSSTQCGECNAGGSHNIITCEHGYTYCTKCGKCSKCG